MRHSCIGSTQTVFSHLILCRLSDFCNLPIPNPTMKLRRPTLLSTFLFGFVCSHSISFYLWIIQIYEGIHATVILRVHSTCVIVNEKSQKTFLKETAWAHYSAGPTRPFVIRISYLVKFSFLKE
jgi:hypothetical protein